MWLSFATLAIDTTFVLHSCKITVYC